MMLAMEEVLCELSDHEKKNGQGLPPGFRFHPTDEELITFYLASKVFNGSFSSTTTNVKFAEVDLNRCEPWELPDVAKMGEREWYLFSLRDRKYPTGLRTNRATGAGYWKATGKDKEVYSGSLLIGMKKTLVFYKGRAPRGEKTKWVMHEYRLDGHFSPINSHSHHHRSRTCKEEWVICRIFHKSGEKRTQLLQGQQHLGASSSPKKTCLPPLLQLQATPTSFTTLELHESQSQQVSSPRDFQNDLSFSHHLFPLHAAFQQYSFPIAAAATNNTQGGEIISHARGRNHPSSELLFNLKSSHLSQHNNNCPTLKQTIPKTEATTTFYEIHQSLDHDDGTTSNNNLRWMDNSISNDFHNTFRSHETLDSGLMPFSGAAANAEFRDMMPFNRVALEYAPVGIDSWPQPQLV